MKKELIPETTMKWRQVYRIKPQKMVRARKFRKQKKKSWGWRSPVQE